MPSEETKKKHSSLRRRPNIGMKIKFYEKRDNDLDESTLFPVSEAVTGRQRQLSKSSTLPNRRRAAVTRPTLTDVTSKLTVPTTGIVDKKKKEAAKSSSKEYFATDVHLDENENVASSTSRSKNREYDLNKEKPRSYHNDSIEESSPSFTSTSSSIKGEQTPPEDHPIPFLSAENIGRIYQSQPYQHHTERNFESFSPDPGEYQWKIVESRKNLQELQKSLSDEFTPQASEDKAKATPEILTSQILQTPTHKRVAQQDSNTSISSNLSTSSTLSTKLLSLSEDTKAEKLPRRRSQKSKSKDIAWTQSSLNSRERSGSQVNELSRRSRRKRQTISVIQYSEDDVKSTPKHTEDTSAEHYSKYSNSETEKKSTSTDTTLNLSPREERDPISEDKKKTHEDDRSYSKKFNSMPRMHSKYVFRVDLDEQLNDSSEKSTRTKDRQTSEEIMITTEDYRKIDGKDSSTEQSYSQWTKREDPPNDRVDPDETTSTHSKRLQVRPWNMLGHLSNNVTQTTAIKTKDTVSQTKKKYFEMKSSQTEDKTYRTKAVQTDIPTEKRDFEAQMSPILRSIDVQTTNEVSEGATVSLDNLIRLGAIKRTKSMGQGLPSNLERPHVRSSSTDFKPNLRKEAIQANGNRPTTKSSDGTETSGKIASYNWNENKKFVKIFVSYSGIHLIPSKNIEVKTNGINLLLTVEECISRTKDGDELRTMTSTLYLDRLRRPVSCLSYNVQRDMVTIMLRKQKQTPWNALLYSGANA